MLAYLGVHSKTLLGPAGRLKQTRGSKDRCNQKLHHVLCHDPLALVLVLVLVLLAPQGAWPLKEKMSLQRTQQAGLNPNCP